MENGRGMQKVVQAIVERVVAGYRPSKIILFGSYAYGQPDKDIDLLIIKETPERFLDRVDKVREAAAGAHPCIPFEPIVLTPAEIEEGLRSGNQFIAEILQKGELLYAA
jgi:predicted nucleotidyltransferase